ncbi:hypothetical protein [Aestuariivita sp.]|uniref:hypothetical protein n=1 Tax=Aestuariivita sp. TaxID=1872407 RepID=UPI00216F30EB|nr:hypothetical protein [Aestuariivita sp.]MCE8008597.1 hypothetical protein [Aestuariivita sp.]
MSAPDTNLDKQARRHGPPLWAMALAISLTFAGALAVAIWTTEPSDGPPVPTVSTSQADR